MVYADEVMDLLAMVGRGEVTPTRVEPEDSIDADSDGEIEFLVGCHYVIIAFDCGEFSGVYSVLNPDGEHGEFDDWAVNPAEMLVSVDPALFAKMEQAFLDAR